MMILLLAHFPTLYRDELLYSGIARYHQISGNRTQKQTIADLFGDRLACATVDLPSHLKELSRRLNERYSADYLIEHHTLFPYYTYFLNNNKSNQIKDLMRQGATSGVIHANLGLLAGLIKSSAYLKYCPVCYTEDREPYWHRSHQLPGVVFCEVHNVPLVITDLTYSTHDHQFAFTPLNELGVSGDQKDEVNPVWVEHLQFIAEQSALILHSPSTHEVPTYISLLGAKGYLTAGKRIRFDKFINDFQKCFSEDLLNKLHCDINPRSSDTWLHKMLRGNEVTQPLRHILISRFLGLEVGNYFSIGSYLPFGKGPWPCLNVAAQHYETNIVAHCNITRCSKSGLPVGTFACSCGFVYSRRGPDNSTDDRYKIGRIKWFGSVWYEKLKELAAGNNSLRAKARILGVDPGTVKTQEELLNNNVKSTLQFQIQKHSEVRILERRERARVLTKNSFSERVDWGKRDELLSGEIAKAVERIKDLDTPERITVNSIVRQIPDQKLSIKIFKKSLDKLPMSKNLIQASLETTEDFQVRRLIWAGSKLRDLEMKVLGWRLLKKAGLNHPLSEVVEQKFYELVS